MVTRALVLGGGGPAGVAWELGILAGLADAGVDLAGADLIVGTSGGAAVGSQLTSGIPLAELYRVELAGAIRPGTPTVVRDPDELESRITSAMHGASDTRSLRARIGAMALATPTAPEHERRKIIEARLPTHTWPETKLVVTAVDAETGEWVAWDRESGVELVDAVSAACAVPGVWPPVTIGGRRYMDAGVRSATNADLATGYDRVVVIAPLGMAVDGSAGPDDVAVARLRERSEVVVLTPDDRALADIGPNPLDPSVRPAAARAGFSQAAGVADAVRAVWVV